MENKMEEILTLDQIVTEFVKDESNQEYIEFLEQKIMQYVKKFYQSNLKNLKKENGHEK